MDNTTRAYRAEQAKRILDEPMVGEVLSAMRQDALEALARVAPEDISGIHKLQAEITVLDGFKDSFEAFVLDGEEVNAQFT